jgi:hypothetical protein
MDEAPIRLPIAARIVETQQNEWLIVLGDHLGILET